MRPRYKPPVQTPMDMANLFKRFGFAAVVMTGLMAMLAVVAGKAAWTAVAGSEIAQAASGGGRAGGGGAPVVVAAAVERQTFSDTLQAIGTAQARESIVLTPKVADTIRAIRFESGARVRRGQVLVEMSSVEQGAALSESQAANEAAQEELRRTQELFERGFASQARLDAVQASADVAQARVSASSSRIADRTIRAPFAGVVGLRTASPGEYMRPGDQIGTLDDISEIKLDFTVPETQVARVAQGVEIVARTAAYPDRTFSGAIATVDSRVDPTTRTVRVRAMLPNTDEIIRPGMLMNVEVRSNPRQALAAPEIALVDQADGVFAFRIVQGEGGVQRAERVQVQTGVRSNGLAEIVSGLNEGDRIVTDGVQSVRPGQPVRIEDGQAEAPAGRPRG